MLNSETAFPKVQCNFMYVYISVRITKQSFVNSKSNLHSRGSSSQLVVGEVIFFTVSDVSLVLSAPVFASVTRRWGSSEVYPVSLGNPRLHKSLIRMGTLCGLPALGNLFRKVLEGHPQEITH